MRCLRQSTQPADSARSPGRRALRGGALILTLLLIEFLDEFVFGAYETAWPLIRDDLALSYTQIGLLFTLPALFSNLVEPILGILSDLGRRRVLILGGGVAFALALVLAAASQSFFPLLFASLLLFPASGAFVSLSQAALMDTDPARHEQNMARWTLAGSIGMVLGPLALGAASVLGLGWRGLFVIFAGLALALMALAARQPVVHLNGTNGDDEDTPGFRQGLRLAWQAIRRRDVLRWLVLLQFSDLMLDVLYGFLALYFVDVVGVEAGRAGLAVAVWTGVGLVGDLLMIPLLERVRGLPYLRVSAALVLITFPAFLLAGPFALKLALLGGLDVDFIARSDEPAIRCRVRRTLDVCQPGGLQTRQLLLRRPGFAVRRKLLCQFTLFQVRFR